MGGRGWLGLAPDYTVKNGGRHEGAVEEGGMGHGCGTITLDLAMLQESKHRGSSYNCGVCNVGSSDRSEAVPIRRGLSADANASGSLTQDEADRRGGSPGAPRLLFCRLISWAARQDSTLCFSFLSPDLRLFGGCRTTRDRHGLHQRHRHVHCAYFVRPGRYQRE